MTHSGRRSSPKDKNNMGNWSGGEDEPSNGQSHQAGRSDHRPYSPVAETVSLQNNP